MDPAYTVTDIWVLLTVINDPCYKSVHITSTKNLSGSVFTIKHREESFNS
jgi:hypothetical protein